MTDLVIFVNGMDGDGMTNDINYSGYCRCGDMDGNDSAITWNTSLASNSLAATVNAAIKTSATAAATTAGHTVGLLDKKTLIGSAVGL